MGTTHGGKLTPVQLRRRTVVRWLFWTPITVFAFWWNLHSLFTSGMAA